jgi:hypothetical protein
MFTDRGIAPTLKALSSDTGISYAVELPDPFQRDPEPFGRAKPRAKI